MDGMGYVSLLMGRSHTNFHLGSETQKIQAAGVGRKLPDDPEMQECLARKLSWGGRFFFVTNGKFFVFLNHPWVWWENSTTLGFDENLTSFHQPLDLGVDCLFHDSEIGLYLSFLIFVLSVKCCTWGNSDVFSCSPVPLEINWDEVPMNIAG